MKVFKFGGASIRNVAAAANMAEIVAQYQGEKILIVVSAMGKTTNHLEEIVDLAFYQHSFVEQLEALRNFHYQIAQNLFDNETHPLFDELGRLFIELESNLTNPDYTSDKNILYDQVVSRGEIISSTILAHYLNYKNTPTYWLDAREVIRSDHTFREGKIDWELTDKYINYELPQILESKFIITQGFIAKTNDGFTVTLGREGSDFTAAIFATCLKAESVTIWKDVPGVLNADPKVIRDTVKYEELPYQEAAEMTYYGASVIHPKTIKPLANSNIPLLVRSFEYPQEPGTRIHHCEVKQMKPAIIFKYNQSLISFHMKDLTFINEKNLSIIFHLLDRLNIKINMMQNSAISFSICVDNEPYKVDQLIDMLKNDYRVRYNNQLTLISVKHYDDATIDLINQDRNILLEQKTRNTYQIVVN